MEFVEQKLKVSDIRLDQENPRFPPTSNQREAINAMLSDQGEKIVNLAIDIYQNGLNPSTRLIVFKEGENYIDGDGNRRITALKILETPNLAATFPNIKRKIEAILKKPGSVPMEVDCVIFNDRAAARPWIFINHGGEQEGRGQITWSAEQKNRFERKPSIGLDALDQLLHRGLITNKDKSEINKSTLDRLLSYKDVKSRLSILKNGDHFIFGNIDHLAKVVLSLRNKSVDTVYTAEKGQQFVDAAIAVATTSSEEVNSFVSPGVAEFHQPGQLITATTTRSRRTRTSGINLFGGPLSLKKGHLNNLYRDIEWLYNAYQANKKNLTPDFTAIIRMALRLIAETATHDIGLTKLDEYIDKFYDQAKSNLSKDIRTMLACHSIEKNSFIKLLHVGAHNYKTSRNEEQTLAISVMLGAMLAISHRKES